MNFMMFPKMLTSHGEGWDWLMRVHPSVSKLYVSYVVPMSLIPPAMLIYAWRNDKDAPFIELSQSMALLLAALFFVAELAIVPAMARVVQRIGELAGSCPPYERAFTLSAVAPTPFWLAPIALFVPSLAFNTLVMILALIGAATLIYQGVDRIFRLQDEKLSLLVAGAVLAAGLAAWITMMALAFACWGIVLA